MKSEKKNDRSYSHHQGKLQSRTEQYVSSKAALEGSDWWANSKSLKIQEYFLNQWMRENMPKKRMECYRRDRSLFSVRTNNGIEHINNPFKQNFSHYKTNNGLTRVLHIIVTHFTHFLFQQIFCACRRPHDNIDLGLPAER
ncbi:uncharacterized protein [Watersipora subatra]|uniref:uncharacterized protein n=1 Tax=Watersipora subatra TaxID=2589382 RepID=UPI00355AD868